MKKNDLMDAVVAVGANKRVRELADELEQTRNLLMTLVAPKVASKIRPPRAISNRHEAVHWFDEAMDKVAGAAVIIPYDPRNGYGHQGDRALCPLCGGGQRGNLNRLEPGFSLDPGLYNHLTARGNARMCEVAAIALKQAHHMWRYPQDDA